MKIRQKYIFNFYSLSILKIFFIIILGMEDENLCVDAYYEAFNCFGCPLFNDKTSIEDIEYALKKFAENQQLPADQKVSVWSEIYSHVDYSILYFLSFIIKYYCKPIKFVGI